MADDIKIQTGGLREFGYSGPELDTAPIQGKLGRDACAGLPCRDFKTSIAATTEAMLKALTQYQQGLNALRTGAVTMAGIYEDGEYRVTNTIASVVKTPAGLPDVNRVLQDAANGTRPTA